MIDKFVLEHRSSGSRLLRYASSFRKCDCFPYAMDLNHLARYHNFCPQLRLLHGSGTQLGGKRVRSAPETQQGALTIPQRVRLKGFVTSRSFPGSLHTSANVYNYHYCLHNCDHFFVIKHACNLMVYLSGVASGFIFTAPCLTRNAYKMTIGKLGKLSNSKYLCSDETRNLISVNKQNTRR